MSLDKKFKDLENRLDKQIHLINQFSGIPFIILIYDPQDQKECYEKIEHLINKLKKDQDKEVLNVPIGDFVFNYLEEQGEIEKKIEEEKNGYSDEVRQELGKKFENNYNTLLMSKIEQVKPDLIFFTKVGGLYPYNSLSSVLSNLEKINIPIIAFYPGKIINDELYCLGKFKSDNYYRAFRI